MQMAVRSSSNLIEPCEEECTPLLSNSVIKRRRRRWYTCKWIIKSKGTILILIWLALVQSFDPVVAISLAGFGSEGRQDKVYLIYTCCSFFFYLFFPVIGLYADVKFGQRRIAQAVIFVSLLCTFLVGIGAGLAEDRTDVVSLVIFSFGFVIGSLAQTAFLIVMASYGFEQLAGASSEELSAYAHWYYWCRIFGWFVTVPVTCLVHIRYGVLIVYALHIICLLVISVSACLSKKFGIIETQLSVNPLTQMVKVCKYARRNKYSKNRSALTYWEEVSPSRLDLGKEKYGGPFTEDQVEDVKTFLQMLPLIICMVFFVVTVDQFNPYFFMIHDEDKGRHFVENCLLSSVYFINSLTILITMFVYQVFKPLFDQCLPTMLRRIGIGIFLAFMAEVMWLCIDVAGHFKSDNSNSTCLFNIPPDDATTIHWNISHMWVLFPKVVMGISFGIATPMTLEFVFAQAPRSMKGLVIGVWFMAIGSIKMIGYNMHYPFALLDGVWPNCSFYYYITKTGLVGVSFVCFLVLGMWYTPRQRELLYNSHITVEDYYERDFMRRRLYEDEKRRKKLSGEVERDVATIDINEYLSSLYQFS